MMWINLTSQPVCVGDNGTIGVTIDNSLPTVTSRNKARLHLN